ncbi:MAG: transcriptional regulator [Candidatus Bathyarchaeia archaeon]|jgi:predicted DNA-binding transcriptional regulator
MNKDQGIGAVILVASIIGIILYAWLLFTYAIVVLQITAFVAVAAVLVILAWIGWTMATTPPPAPLETEPPTTPSTEGTANLERK